MVASAASPSKKMIIGLLFLGFILCAVLIFGMNFAVTRTSTMTFCVSCHSMQAPLAEYQGSVHYLNEKGIRAECADCHLPPTTFALLRTKVIQGVKDVWGEMTGKIDTPEKYAAHKLAMAKSVWKQLESSDSAPCKTCHSFDAMDLLKQRPAAQQRHAAAMQAGLTCITCHKGIAHILPDMHENTKESSANLHAHVKNTATEAKVLYATKTAAISVSKDLSAQDGRIMPSTRVEVIDMETNQFHGRINGWQQANSPTVIYAEQGKRILSVILDKQAIKAVKIEHQGEKDQTGIAWNKVSLDIWIKRANFVDNLTPLWDYASTLMNAKCGGCHATTNLTSYSANQWVGVMKSMVPMTSMTQEEQNLLMQYVQKHASDTAKDSTSAQ